MGKKKLTDVMVVPIDSVVPHPKNPRRGDVKAIEESIRANGFRGLILVQKSSRLILVGNHRWKAAKNVGMKEIPVWLEDVDDEQALKILLADNRASDLSSNDDESLLAALRSLDRLDGTGYDPKDLDNLMKSLQPSVPPEEFGDLNLETVTTKHTCPKCGFGF